jgi:hypothetical protein
VTGGGLLGTGLICTGVKQSSEEDLLPRQTVQTIKEELTGTIFFPPRPCGDRAMSGILNGEDRTVPRSEISLHDPNYNA